MSTNFLVENNILVPTTTATTSTVADVYSAEGGFHVSPSNGFYATMWVKKNGQLMVNNLGTCDFDVLDADRTLVPGLSATGLTANADGIFRLTPVPATGLIDLTHFHARISIYADGDDRVNIIPFTLGE